MDQIRYKVAEVARMVGVSPSTLRLWQQQGLVEPIRTESGQRLYDETHVALLKQISWLRRDKGLNPAAIRARLIEADQLPQPTKTEPSHPSRPVADIGRKLRYLRKEAGMTLEKLSHKTGLPVSALSTFERTSQGLSLKTLHDVAHIFGTTISILSGQEENQLGESLIRDREWPTWPATSTGVTIRVLAQGRNQMECHRFELAPGASGEGVYAHDGEEFIHVLSGRLEIVLDGDRFFDLRAGDSFYFESRRPHSWRNNSAEETVLIWINTPPTF